LGLLETVKHLDKAENHISQNNFSECLKSSRTAYEKMIDWQIRKRGLEQTNNYKNDLERLSSKGYLDDETTDLIQTYYRWLSNIAVHGKSAVEPGFYEAQMGYRITLIMLEYFANKLP
jgi:competence protein ComGC